MSLGAIVVMVLGIVIIWGGFAASIIHALRKSKK